MPNLPAPYPSSSSNRQVSHELAVLAALGSVVGVEIGAALGKGLFAQVPPTTAAWLRFTFAAVVLLSMRGVGAGLQRLRGRPVPPRPRLTWTAVLSALPYCLALAGKNWSFYLEIETIPLGIADTNEYLGPMAVAIIGSRGRLDLLWAGLAGVGVALLGLRPVALDPRGVGFILVAATCWAGYITLGVRARRHWAGADLVTMACLFGSVTLAGPAVAFGGANLWTWGVLAMGPAVGFSRCRRTPWTWWPSAGSRRRCSASCVAGARGGRCGRLAAAQRGARRHRLAGPVVRGDGVRRCHPQFSRPRPGCWAHPSR